MLLRKWVRPEGASMPPIPLRLREGSLVRDPTLACVKGHWCGTRPWDELPDGVSFHLRNSRGCMRDAQHHLPSLSSVYSKGQTRDCGRRNKTGSFCAISMTRVAIHGLGKFQAVLGQRQKYPGDDSTD